VIASIDVLARQRTLLLITHDLSLAAQADRVLYLEGGRLIEDGTHTRLMRAGGRYATVFRLQAGSSREAAASSV
jgi:ABC-type multidrug transport system fused ATPase/permease subunit